MKHHPNGDPPYDELVVQYVLGELPRAQAAAFERRMAADPTLRDDVRRLKNTLELMPYASVTAPPPALRASVLQAAQAEPAAASAPVPVPMRRARRIVWSRYAAAAAAVFALVLGIDRYRLRSELELQRDVTAVLQEPNVVRSFRLADTRPSGRAFGSVVLDLDAKKGAVVLRHLPPLPPEHVYRLWARVGDASVPCGEFVAAADGTVRAPFQVPVESYTAPIAGLFVTVESRTGGERPTGPTVMESV